MCAEIAQINSIIRVSGFQSRDSGYSGYSKKHSIPRDRWHIYLTEYFFTETRHLPKNLMVTELPKNILIFPKLAFPRTRECE